ncbi:MAG: hypothetical protein WAN11_15895 [Syntrophobacteraceae bacterium]
MSSQDRPSGVFADMVFEEIVIPEFTPVVLRSRQLAGGVGGYPARSMK